MQIRICLLTVLVTGPATLTLVLRICHFQPRWQRVLQVPDPTPQFWDVGFHWCHYSARISASPGVQQQEKVPAFQPETHAQLFSPAPTTARAIATKTTTVSLSHGGTHCPTLCISAWAPSPQPRLCPRPTVSSPCTLGVIVTRCGVRVHQAMQGRNYCGFVTTSGGANRL